MIDLTSTLASFAVPVTLVHRPPGYLDARGINHAADSIEESARCVVLPLPPAERERILPEGAKAEDALTIYSPKRIRGTDDPDGYWATRFVWRGRKFEIQQVFDRNEDGNGRFWRGVALRVFEAEAEET